MATQARTALDNSLAIILASGTSITAQELRQSLGLILDYVDANAGGGTTPPANVLATPTGFAATATSSSQIGTSWNQVANNAGYEVQYATNNTFTQGLGSLATGAGSTSLALTGLQSATTYYLRVRAIGGGSYATSGYSSPVQATTATSATSATYTATYEA